MAAPAVGVKASVTGGRNAARIIKAIGTKLKNRHVAVGFLSSATYPAFRKKYNRAGKSKVVPVPVLPVAQVAFWNEYGTSTAPARPFFRNMITKQSPHWGEDLGKILKGTNYNEMQTLGQMGELLKGELRESIIETNSPPNAERTIIEKGGASKPLVGVSGIMLGSVAYETGEGSE